MRTEDLNFIPEFYDTYINLADPKKDLLTQLEKSINEVDGLKKELIAFQDYQYEEGKWTPKDILQHIIDTERVQAYRALAFARNDQNSMPGYDENSYANSIDTSGRSIDDLLDELRVVRKTTIALFSNFTDEMLLKEGVCSKVKISVLALGFVIVGHPLHHYSTLKERYFQRSE